MSSIALVIFFVDRTAPMRCRNTRCWAPICYLLSDMSRGVTGEVHHVDAGYHIVGMKNPAAPDIGALKE